MNYYRGCVALMLVALGGCSGDNEPILTLPPDPVVYPLPQRVPSTSVPSSFDHGSFRSNASESGVQIPNALPSY